MLCCVVLCVSVSSVSVSDERTPRVDLVRVRVLIAAAALVDLATVALLVFKFQNQVRIEKETRKSIKLTSCLRSHDFIAILYFSNS